MDCNPAKRDGNVRFGVIGLILLLLSARSNYAQETSQLERIKLPGYRAHVSGRWEKPGSTMSGVPLGGIGAGYMELRPDGRIYDAQFRMLGESKKCAPFRVSAQVGTENSVTLVASADLPDPAPVPLRYLGHHPFVELDYGRPTAAPVSITCRAFSPLIIGDAEASNTPAAIFSVRLLNEAATPVQAKLRLTWLVHSDQVPAIHFGGDPGTERGLLMRSGDATYALAAAAPGWTTRTLGSHGVEVSGGVGGGAEKVVTLVAGWHVSEERGAAGKRYVPAYTARFADAGAVVRSTLANAARSESRTIESQERIYAAEAPYWLQDAAANSLYLLTRSTAWYTVGCFIVEQNGKVVDSIGSRLDGGLPLAKFFLKLEAEALRRLAARQAETGEIPGRLGFGGLLEAPHFGPGQMHASAEFVLLCRRAARLSGDISLGKELFPAAKKAALFSMSLDVDSDGLIDSPPIARSLATLDRYRRDWLWSGISSYSAFLNLAMLRAATELAQEAGDEEFGQQCRARFESGRAKLEEMLWAERYYRLYVDPDAFRESDSSFVATLAGQTHAWMLNLGDLSDRNRAAVHLQSIARRHGEADAKGIPAGVTPTGRPDETGAPYSLSTSPRDVWLYAACALLLAERANDTLLRERALALAERVYNIMVTSRTLWRQSSTYSPDVLSPSGDTHFFGNLAIWMLFDVLGKVKTTPVASLR